MHALHYKKNGRGLEYNATIKKLKKIIVYEVSNCVLFMYKCYDVVKHRHQNQVRTLNAQKNNREMLLQNRINSMKIYNTF